MVLSVEGTILEALSSVPLSKGGGVVRRVVVGATQPEVELVPLATANCRNISLLTESTGLALNRRAKRATWLPRHLVRGAGAAHEK